LVDSRPRDRGTVDWWYNQNMADDSLINDGSDLVPVTEFDTPTLEFDFPGLEVGVAEYAEGPTGCTVIAFPAGATGLADVRGGAPATILSHREGWVDAICLAGGSVYGLEAATGVSAELLRCKGYDTDWNNIAIVSGAVIFDFNALRRNRAVCPDNRLGRAAYSARRTGVFPRGARGAGACATVGKWLKDPYQPERGGQGAAFMRSGESRIAVFTVVNAVGAIVDRTGRAVRGHYNAQTGERHRVGEIIDYASRPARAPGAEHGPDDGNTTLTVVVINQKTGLRELRQLARQVHASMARAIEPFHTIHDGDVLYALTTNAAAPVLKDAEVNYIASELAWDAVLASF
jgi:L-aminopeptidase/D-esterase-like protein